MKVPNVIRTELHYNTIFNKEEKHGEITLSRTRELPNYYGG